MTSLLTRGAVLTSLILVGLAKSLAKLTSISTSFPPESMAVDAYLDAWTSDSCQFSYARYHLYFTLPPTLLLYLLNRPFLTRLDRAKLILLPAIAFVWTTPWDNELVRQRAWRYPRSCVIGTIGYVPLEEYFFFIIQSVMTTLLASFATRWSLPTFCIFQSPSEKRRSLFARPSALAVTTCATSFVAGLAMTKPGKHSYYLGMILWWCTPPLALLGWGSSNFIARTTWDNGRAAFLFVLVLPTVYLWATDIFALRRGTWHINETTSLNVFVLPDLPVEEMIFFFVTNLILVTASFTFDRCIALARIGVGIAKSEATKTSLSPPFSPSYLPLTFNTIKVLWRTFIVADPSSEGEEEGGGLSDSLSAQTRDLATSLQILSHASKSFSMASLLLPWDLRSDLSVLYAFCRAADDCIDDESAAAAVGSTSPACQDAKLRKLTLLKDLVGAIYTPGSSETEARAAVRATLTRVAAHEVHEKTSTPLGLSTRSREQLRASASSVVSLRHLVPQSLWDELLKGYKRDLDFDLKGLDARFESTAEVIEYAQCVAGCVGEMCVRVVLGRCGVVVSTLEELGLNLTIELDERTLRPSPDVNIPMYSGGASTSQSAARYLIYHARRMGVALQLVNIARDIVDDSIKLRRCYLPLDLVERSEEPALPLLEALFAGRISLDASEDDYDDSSRRRVSPASLRPFSIQLLDLASCLYTSSFPSIQALASKPTQSGLRAACSVYFAISRSILEQTEEEIQQGKRARMGKWRRVWIAARAVYLGEG